ncbi:MAG: hypothetical protein UZ08_BCD001001702 [Candidatus Parvibacillus calidus]|nr:MAG: hypothetical protein UZ08_BCD001001702 [Candidatus Parvibacillus calidus]
MIDLQYQNKATSSPRDLRAIEYFPKNFHLFNKTKFSPIIILA